MVINGDLMMVNDGEYLLVGGIPTPLKNMKVSWDDEIPNWMGKNVPKHQPVLAMIYILHGKCFQDVRSNNGPENLRRAVFFWFSDTPKSYQVG